MLLATEKLFTMLRPGAASWTPQRENEVHYLSNRYEMICIYNEMYDIIHELLMTEESSIEDYTAWMINSIIEFYSS